MKEHVQCHGYNYMHIAHICECAEVACVQGICCVQVGCVTTRAVLNCQASKAVCSCWVSSVVTHSCHSLHEFAYTLIHSIQIPFYVFETEQL